MYITNWGNWFLRSPGFQTKENLWHWLDDASPQSGASQSSLFKEIFEAKEFSPNLVTPKIIRLWNVDPAALEVFINFLYTGNFKMKPNNVSDILKLSETFKVEQLSKHCIDGLKSLSHAELLKLLSIMKCNKNITMCETIMQLLGKQFMAWRKSHEFLSLYMI